MTVREVVCRCLFWNLSFLESSLLEFELDWYSNCGWVDKPWKLYSSPSCLPIASFTDVVPSPSAISFSGEPSSCCSWDELSVFIFRSMFCLELFWGGAIEERSQGEKVFYAWEEMTLTTGVCAIKKEFMEWNRRRKLSLKYNRTQVLKPQPKFLIHYHQPLIRKRGRQDIRALQQRDRSGLFTSPTARTTASIIGGLCLRLQWPYLAKATSARSRKKVSVTSNLRLF